MAIASSIQGNPGRQRWLLHPEVYFPNGSLSLLVLLEPLHSSWPGSRSMASPTGTACLSNTPHPG
eukprot:755998-Pelagomonas_calceolata.AAC.9